MSFSVQMIVLAPAARAAVPAIAADDQFIDCQIAHQPPDNVDQVQRLSPADEFNAPCGADVLNVISTADGAVEKQIAGNHELLGLGGDS